MSVQDGWSELHNDTAAKVRVVAVTAYTHEELGQLLLADPLSAMIRYGELGVDDRWAVQLHVVNAHIPSGPLPLPDQIPPGGDDAGWVIWVIRKIIVILHLFDDLKIAIVIVRRFDDERELTRRDVLETLERSRAS
jgi:hypothetical protein